MTETAAERHMALIRRTIDSVWNKRDWTHSSDSYAEDIVVHSPTQPEPYRGRDDFHRMWVDLTTAYHDFHMEVLDLFGTDSHCAARFRITGTNTGEHFGMP